MVLIRVIQDLMAQPPRDRSKERKNKCEQEEVGVFDSLCPRWEHFPLTRGGYFPPSGGSISYSQGGVLPTLFTVKTEDRNCQSMIAKCTYPQAQASPQYLEHTKRRRAGRSKSSPETPHT